MSTPKRNDDIQDISPELPDIEVPTGKGTSYRSNTPDTLDLAERADHAINAMIGQIAPDFDYDCWWCIDVLPPSVTPHSNQWFDQPPRNLWALTLLRTVTGSSYGAELEQKMMESMLSRVTEAGLYLNAPFDTPGAWWRAGGAGGREKWPTDENFTNIGGLSILLNALTSRYLRDGDEDIRSRAQKVADALSRIAIRKEDYAYYPATCDFGAEYSYLEKSGWPDTKEAISDQDDPEGAVTAYHSVVVYALSRWYEITHDRQALDTAARVVKYILKPRFWTGGNTPWGTTGATDRHSAIEIRAVHGGAERRPAALFQAHQAGMAYTLTGLIEYAIVAYDAYVKEWVRQGYEYFRNLGLPRIGMWGENIANNQMAAVAIKLSDSGVGDYWDDVDQYVRNAFVEDQFVDLGLLKQEAAAHGLPIRQNTELGAFSGEQFLGCLRHEGLIDRNATLDPTNNGAKRWNPKHILYGSCYMEPFYFAWEAIARYRDGVGQVNLLLNRASGWLDIDSYLPYEGKVVLRNKTCKAVFVRIPKWVDRRTLSCSVNGLMASCAWAGNFVVLSGLTGKEVVTLHFPMTETTETYHLLTSDVGPKWWQHAEELPTYVLHLRGNTCVKVEFPNRHKFTSLEPVYPVFQREHYTSGKAPLKTVVRFVADKVVGW